MPSLNQKTQVSPVEPVDAKDVPIGQAGLMPVPSEQRPWVQEPFHTADLPDTPQRDRSLPADRWVEAPDALLRLAADLGHPVALYKRRIGQRWLLWRAGPAVGDHARYLAIDAFDLDRSCAFTLDPSGSGSGVGPNGEVHDRFRSWKEALRDSDTDSPTGPVRGSVDG